MATNVLQSIEDLKKQYDNGIERLKREFEEKVAGALEPARKRLDEIQEIRAQLDEEERQLLGVLTGGKKDGRRRRRAGTRRVTAQHKKEVLSKFISKGHIKNGTILSRELRAALSDEGIGTNDFRNLTAYLPAGWQAKSNGQRGTAAQTVFHQS
jgi:hypothetical protein